MTVLLGIYLNHDANVAVSINGKIKYRKAERLLGEKHARANIDFVLNALKDWGITKVDHCAYCPSSVTLRDTCREDQLFGRGTLDKYFSSNFCVDHHYAHVLSSWPVVDTETLDYGVCIDGKGDKYRSTTVIKHPALNPKIVKVETFPHLGFEFYMVGALLNFSGLEFDLAGKLMGLQAYPEEKFKEFGLKAFSELFLEDLPSYKAGARHTSLSDWHEYWWDYVNSLFTFNEDAIITYTGGCAQNSVYNYNLKKKFRNLHIPPHCYDGGLSLGCLEFLRLKLKEDKFDTAGFPYWQDDDVGGYPDQETIKRTAELLARGNIVGWMQGRGELGPRALGNRSILMSPDKGVNKDILNTKVKFREPWRPYAGVVLKDKALKYFDMEESPYMLYASKVVSDAIPAITHVDKTCRMQTVASGPLHSLVSEYEKLTGMPILLNTSMNIMGKPIVSLKQDALKLFNSTAMDSMVIGNEIHRKCKKFL
jgi:carbamoyltransferase